MQKKLPKKLGKEPLFDALFEIRFGGSKVTSTALPLAGIVLGHLFSKIGTVESIQELAGARIPKPIRDSDPTLQYTPTHSFESANSIINISDRSIIVSAKYPYPGWAVLKPEIVKIVFCLSELPMLDAFDRFSLKYLDLIPGVELRDQAEAVNLTLKIADNDVLDQHFSIKVEIQREGVINLVEMIAGGTVNLPDGATREGLVLSVDSILNVNGCTFDTLLKSFEADLERVHDVNKSIFFECITDSTLESLEPVYE